LGVLVKLYLEIDPDLGFKGVLIRKASIEKGQGIKLMHSLIAKIQEENKLEPYRVAEQNL